MTAHRAELIADLRAFGDLLEVRPDLTINPDPWMKLQYSVINGTEADRLAEVERVAAVLGVDAELNERGVTATLAMGCIEYVVHATTDFGDALYDAEWSYRGVIEPELAVAR